MARAKVPKVKERHWRTPCGEPFRKSQETMILAEYENKVVATAHTKAWGRRITKALDLLAAVERGEVKVEERR